MTATQKRPSKEAPILEPEAHCAVMRALTQEYDFADNPGIRDGWEQLRAHSDRVIRENRKWATSGYFNPDGPKSTWYVLTPETGTGKSLSLAAYCAAMPDNIGALVAIPLKEAADKFACQVNKLAPELRAVSIHSGTDGLTPEEAAKYQVVVMTQVALGDVLNSAAVTQQIGYCGPHFGRMSRWRLLEHFKGARRPLVVVDEAFHPFAHAVIDHQGLRALIEGNRTHLFTKFPEVLTALEYLSAEFERVDQPGQGQPSELILSRDRSRQWWEGHPTLRESIGKCFALDPRTVFSGKSFEASDFGRWCADNEVNRKDYVEEMRERLASALAQLRKFILYSSQGPSGSPGRGLFSTAWNILPAGGPNMLILDATGRLNRTYALLGDQCRVIERPRAARNYGAMTIHFCRQQGTGKGASNKRVSDRAMAWVKSIDKHVPESDRVLVFCHKGALRAKSQKDNLASYLPKHWKAVNWRSTSGTNDYAGFPVVALYSLFHRARRQTVVEAFAARGIGPEDKERLNAIVQETDAGQIAAEAVQALNRGRSRKAIDAFGNCLPMSAFVPLPLGELGNRIRALILEQLPGAQVVEWDIGQLGGIRRPDRPQVLAQVLAKMGKDRVTGLEIRERLNLSASQWKKLKAKLNAHGSRAAQALSEVGYRYCPGRGKGNHSYFERMETQ